ncbi:hypothetical protein DVH24_014489 [Malus domestica]|uniref:Uncharacterized protein n=1 Tax=Malus domestica TaxID=3750 RepID=A0A498KSA9_MALDO|nr:hypothetical protein DVH24_014489 [Malus domestica]
MIHQGIRDVKVEDIEIDDPITEKVEDSSIKATEKTVTRKRKTNAAAKDVMEPDKRSKTNEAPQCSTIDEAKNSLTKFLKLNLDYQTHIHGIDTTITNEMFNQFFFEKCTGMEQMRYMVLKQMMMHAIDNLQTVFVVSGQTTGKLQRDNEKLKEEKKLNKKKISDIDVEIQQLQLKNAEASGKVNLLLNEIGILKNKLQENQTKVPEVPIDDQMEG